MTTPRNNAWKVIIPVLVIIAGAVMALSAVKYLANRAGHEPKLEGGVEITEGVVLPDFVVTKFGGGQIRFSELPAKIVMLNFWATWCQGCVAEMPSMAELRKLYLNRGFDVLAVSVDEQPEAVLPKFLQKFKIDYPVFVDPQGELSRIFDVHGIPFTLIISVMDRKVLMVQGGERDWNTKEIRNRLEVWLK